MIPPVRDLSLRTRIVAAFAAVLGVSALILLLWLPARLQSVEEAWLERKAVALAQVVARSVEPGIDFADVTFVTERLSVLQTVPDARFARVISDAVVLAEWGDAPQAQNGARLFRPGTVSHQDLLLVEVPLQTKGGALGSLQVAFDQAEIDKHFVGNLRLTGTVLLLMWLLGLGVSWGMGSVLIRPLHALTEAARTFGQGREVHVPLPADGRRYHRDEARVLAQTFRAMLERITAQVGELEREKRRALAAEVDAVRASVTKSQFLANMSHELRTPLNAIIGYCELLIEEADALDPEQLRSDLGRTLASTQHLLALINDVLDLSKVEAQQLELVWEHYHVGRMIEALVAEVQPLLAKNRNTLRLQISPELGVVMGDVTRTRQCLLNLLSNANKFTADGTVSLSARLEEPWLCFEVRDTGIGIPEDKQKRLFRPFVQADATTTRRYGGTGLGLALTRRLCELMGGAITLRSQLGVGTTLEIRLPIRGPVPLRADTTLGA